MAEVFSIGSLIRKGSDLPIRPFKYFPRGKFEVHVRMMTPVQRNRYNNYRQAKIISGAIGNSGEGSVYGQFSDIVLDIVKSWDNLIIGDLKKVVPLELDGVSDEQEVAFTVADLKLWLEHDDEFASFILDKGSTVGHFNSEEDSERLKKS